jgi:RND superfamily putative drug exporter
MVMLPLFIPIMVRLFGEANWWPFMKQKKPEGLSVPAAAPVIAPGTSQT